MFLSSQREEPFGRSTQFSYLATPDLAGQTGSSRHASSSSVAKELSRETANIEEPNDSVEVNSTILVD